MQLIAHRPADWTDRVICWWTRGLVSHVAIVIGGFVYEAVPGAGVRRVSEAAYFEQRPRGQYEFFDLPACDERRAEAFAAAQLGKRYDWRAILGFATLDRATRERAGYWQCAEFAYAVSAQAGVFLFARERTNPAQLWPALLPLSPFL